MVKAYLRYEHTGNFGVIAGAGTLAYDPKTNLLAAAALENIAVWNVKQASLVSTYNSVDSFTCRECASRSLQVYYAPAHCRLQCLSLSNPCTAFAMRLQVNPCFAVQVRKLTAASTANGRAAAEVTQLAASAATNLLASGYSDGTV